MKIKTFIKKHKWFFALWYLLASILIFGHDQGFSLISGPVDHDIRADIYNEWVGTTMIIVAIIIELPVTFTLSVFHLYPQWHTDNGTIHNLMYIGYTFLLCFFTRLYYVKIIQDTQL